MRWSKSGVAERYRRSADLARHATNDGLPEFLEEEFQVETWRFSDIGVIEKTWSAPRAFDWSAIFQDYQKEPDALGFGIWSQGVLCGMGLITLTNSAAVLRFVERNKAESAGLRGLVVLISLDVATNYCQSSGGSNLWLEPKTDELAQWYQERFGFDRAEEGGRAICKKKVN